MAMIKCKECGKEISSEASICPNCGRKINTAQPWLIATGIAFGVIFLMSFCIFFMDQMIEVNSKKVTENSKVYKMGTIAEVGNWEVQILNVENKKNIAEELNLQNTEDNYAVVKLKIKNLSKEPSSLTTTKVDDNTIFLQGIFYLTDEEKTYYPNHNLESYINDFNIYLDKVNPNTTIEYSAVFETDLPTTEKEFLLKLEDYNNTFFRLQ